MGTRSLTHVYDGDTRVVTIYQQYDGYPQGVGRKLATFLTGFEIVNGFGADAKLGKVANGYGCLAAQLIAHLKTAVGDVYVATPGDMGQEFEYEIHVTTPDLFSTGSIRFVVRQIYGHASKLFDGTPAEFLEFLTTFTQEN